MSEQIDDKAFEQYLSRQGPVSLRYRGLDAPEPPPELDRLVLERASQAAKKRRSPPAWRTWSVPVALAASTVLAIAVVMESGVTPKSEVRKEVSLPVRAPVEAPALAEKPTAADLQAPAESRDAGVARVEPPASAAPAPAPVPAPTRARAPDAPAAAAAIERRAVEAAPRAQQQAAATQERQDQRGLEQVTVSGFRPQQSLTDVPVATSAAPEEPAPAAAELRSTSLSRSEERASRAASVEEVAIAANRSRTRAVGPRGTVRRSESARIDREKWEEEQRESDPERWLEYIRELRADRKHQAADREWRKFRRLYPDYAVEETDAAQPRR